MSETETVATTFHVLPIEALVESPWNPRKHFDQRKLDELANSILTKGIIEPIVARLNGKADQFEIVAGARRFRAAKLAGLKVVPVLVRKLDDIAALELAVVENGQRDDMHPLEEAGGFLALQQADHTFTPAVIAAKVGKSESYIYRRLKLLLLVPDAARAFQAGAMSAAHAERLARLSPALQQQAFDDVLYSPMFQWTDEEEDKPAGERIPNPDALRPLADLDAFIRKHSALDPDSEDARLYFPELQDDIQEAIENETPGQARDHDDDAPATLLQLSTSNFVRQELGLAKGVPAPLSVKKWHEIKNDRDRCPHTVAGAIVHGAAYRALNVCATKGCPKHFPIAPKPKSSTAAADREPAQPSYEERERAREQARQDWAALLAAAAPAFAAHVKGTKFNAALVKTVVDVHTLDRVAQMFGVKLTDQTAAQVLLLTSIDTWTREVFLRDIKPFKFNIGSVEQKLKADTKKAAADTSKPEKAASVKKPAKKSKKARR